MSFLFLDKKESQGLDFFHLKQLQKKKKKETQTDKIWFSDIGHQAAWDSEMGKQ